MTTNFNIVYICKTALLYGLGCITMAALSSLLDWGVLQVQYELLE